MAPGAGFMMKLRTLNRIIGLVMSLMGIGTVAARAEPLSDVDAPPIQGSVLVFVPEVMNSSFQSGPFGFVPDGLAPIFLDDRRTFTPLLQQMSNGLRGKWHVFPSPVLSVNVDASTASLMTLSSARRLHEVEVPNAPWPPPRPPVAISQGNRTIKKVALTFDACTGSRRPKLDGGVETILERLKVPATIFVSGHWAERAPDLVRRLASNPLFEIGNHSYFHSHLVRISESQLVQEIQWTQDMLFRLTGKVPELFRAPFGEVDGRVLDRVAKMGLRTIQFDVESGDPDPRVSSERMVRWVVNRSRAGSIIVMHINGRGRHTAAALPEIVAMLRQRGYELVTVSELLKG